MKKIILLLFISAAFFNGCSNKTSKLDNDCERGIVESCYKLGEIYFEGSVHLEVKKDINKAISFYKKACDSNAYKACMKIANIYNLGTEIQKSETFAIRYYKKACDGKYALGCLMLEQKYRILGDEQKASEYSNRFNKYKNQVKYTKKTAQELDIACKNNNFESCEKLGFRYMYGDSVKQDYAIAFKYFDKVFNNKKGCFLYDNLGAHGKENSLVNAEKVWMQGCKKSCIRSCKNLGVMYANGNNNTKAQKFLKIACDSTATRDAQVSMEACILLGRVIP